MMMRFLKPLLLIILFSGCSVENDGTSAAESGRVNESAEGAETSSGRLVKLGEVQSKHVRPREVQVWLPPDYDKSAARYPVLYMHDGQNLFERGYSYTGDEWRVDETMERLIANEAVRPAIVVAMHNTGDTRWAEYAPQKVVEKWPETRRDEIKAAVAQMLDGMDDLKAEDIYLQGDAYLRFLVHELKPYIDAEYRTLTDPQNTFLAGSSMGGLISLYGLAEYPDVFGGAACISIHWPIGDPQHEDALSAVSAMQSYLAESRLDPVGQIIWFDRGTETLDAYYSTYADQMEDWFEMQYPNSSENVVFRVYPGTEHNEKAWAARLGDPMTFLLRNEGEE